MKNTFHEFPLTLKSLDESGLFSGYASVYNIEDNHNDVIKNGAFCDSLRKHNYGRNIKLLWQHDTSEPIGLFTKMVEDDIGLYVEGKLLLNVARAREAQTLIQAGAVDGLSIGFTIKDYEINEITGVREIYLADLWEVSLVTFPANDKARITSFDNNHKDTQPSSKSKRLSDFEHLSVSVSRALNSLKQRIEHNNY